MTTPDLMMPYDIVLQPAAGTDITHVMPSYSDSTVSDPDTRMRVPRGISTVMVTNDSAFEVTVKMLRGGSERILGSVNPESSGSMQLITELTDSEMWVTLNRTANTANRIANRIGMKIIPTA